MNDGGRGGVNVVGGLLLVVLGIVFLVGELFHINVWRFSWPFFVIAPGLAFFVGMMLGGRKAGGLAMPGSIVTMVGLILLYQSVFDHWESWAYAWALIFPTAVGIGMTIHGAWSGQDRLFRVGTRMVGWGIAIFVVGATFFELVLNISGFARGQIGGIVGPSLLIALGVYLVLRRTVGSSGAQPQVVDRTPISAIDLSTSTEGATQENGEGGR